MGPSAALALQVRSLPIGADLTAMEYVSVPCIIRCSCCCDCCGCGCGCCDCDCDCGCGCCDCDCGDCGWSLFFPKHMDVSTESKHDMDKEGF